MKGILRFLSPYRKKMGVGFSIKVSGTVFELFLPFILTHILKNVVGSADIKKILLWGALMILCAFAACLCNIIANRKAAKISRDFSEEIRRELFKKTVNLSAEDTDSFTIPSLEARITTDTYNVHNFVNTMQRMGVRAPILLIGGTVFTLIMDSTLSLVMIALLPFIFLTVYSISKNGVPLYTKVQKSADYMTRVVREDSQGIRVIKALSKNEYENLRFDGYNRALSKSERRAGIIMGSVNPIMTLLMNVGIIGVVAFAAYRVSRGLSDAETVIAFIQYFTLISMAVMTLSRIFVMYTKSSASAKRICEVLDTPENQPEKVTEFIPDESKPHIEFKNVSFSYNGKHNQLDDISFSLKRGQRLGIIGSTGSGKSTIVKLLLNFYRQNEGSIRISGYDIESIPSESFSKMFGVALQNGFLFADTIEENIKFGRNISHGDVVFAAEISQADSFINDFPDGYEHILSQKGTNLSGGQKQRILIARAIAASPEILILDDSSSALDYKTDANLRAALATELGDTTLITVAQRVSSVKDSDLILVLDEGKIIGAGKHDDLMQNCTEYREISESQMGGAIVE